jgi:hypothetical protein
VNSSETLTVFEALPVILVSLISIAARQTLCCVFCCPQHSSSYSSAPRLVHWEKERGKPSIFSVAHVSSDSFHLPVGCLSYHLCLELALKLLPR